MNSKNATYSGFQFEVDGHPAFAVINTDLKKMPERFDYDHAVYIELVPAETNENGHPEGAEYEYLAEVEARITEYLEKHAQCLYVGHTTVYQKREIIYYTKAPEEVEDFLGIYLQTVDREANFEIYADKEWENVAPFYDLI